MVSTQSLIFFSKGTRVGLSPKLFPGQPLWRSDGTIEGTFEISGNDAYGLTIHNNQLVYLEHTGAWASSSEKFFLAAVNSDGTTATNRIELPGKVVAPWSIYRLFAPSSYKQFFMRLGNNLYYLTESGQQSVDLWRVNLYSSSLSTTRIAAGLPTPSEMVPFHDGFYFVFDSPEYGYELFKVQGGAVRLVQDIRPGLSGSEPRELTVVGNDLFFTADDGDHGRELWRLDAETDEVFLEKDIKPGIPSSVPLFLIAGRNNSSNRDFLIFLADDGVHGAEPWISSRSSIGELAVPTPTAAPPATPTIAPIATRSPTKTPKPTPTPTRNGGNGITSSLHVRLTPGRISARKQEWLTYTIKGTKDSRETIYLYRRGRKLPTSISVQFHSNTAAGKRVNVPIQAKTFTPGRYSWCVIANTRSGQRTAKRCASLKVS
jgi:ELWxxDGT repeat protein